MHIRVRVPDSCRLHGCSSTRGYRCNLGKRLVRASTASSSTFAAAAGRLQLADHEPGLDGVELEDISRRLRAASCAAAGMAGSACCVGAGAISRIVAVDVARQPLDGVPQAVGSSPRLKVAA